MPHQHHSSDPGELATVDPCEIARRLKVSLEYLEKEASAARLDLVARIVATAALAADHSIELLATERTGTSNQRRPPR